jgi:hypothetical protein
LWFAYRRWCVAPLATEAAEQGVSIDRLVSAKLAAS